MTRRVVVTGLGTVNPLASDVSGFWQGLLEGKSGIGPITLFDTSAFRVRFGGEVKNWQPETLIEGKLARRLDRFAQFALVAAKQAIQDCGLDFSKEDAFRCGCMIASGIGGLSEFEEQHSRYLTGGPGRISPFVIPKMIANSASGTVSIEFGLMGPNTAISTACASASHAIGDAFHTIKMGLADVMVTGGAEAGITPMGLGGFCSSKALSTRNDDPVHASRPFDKDRDGFVLAEGAGIVVLEEYEHAKSRNATIYAEILGCGNTADAFHITQPHEEGLGAAKAMELAVKYAGLNPEDILYVNAHGTSTQLGDVAETKAIKKVFGSFARKLAVSSTKSMLGHLLGASGGVAVIACCLSLKKGVLHPTINLQTPDPNCDLDYIPNQPREVRVKHLITNSFGFGGHNCCLAFGAV
ncbi:beta-ketoacyl-ACP synthase II [Telmatocola sphagniphila]|uniref:3-oxoacyl-[acyl-carrier-protein] synthase 2 n=1 Tax=Telmatocola sphagniphila TaxID=1123043 RepID=A0A8E6B872_9BACT|nr:beta-ketoacyl-ACP synthase II [Telmatocola sphagniphila]QVL33284.1 beta-ketoacyl-ACP synthase II [Telmatocola sphagniphila]